MGIGAVFIDPQTNRPRSGWRAAIFVILFATPRIFLPFIFSGGEAGDAAVFDVGFEMIFAYTVLVAWVVAVSWVCLTFLERLSLKSLGFDFHKGWSGEILRGCLIAALMVIAVAALQYLGGGTRVAANPIWWRADVIDWNGLLTVLKDVSMALGLLILAAAFEELLYRGYPFQTLLRGLPAYMPVALFAALFGIAHLGNPGRTMFSTANTVLAGIWLALAYLKTRSLWFPTAMHFTWNWTMGALLGLPVSGLSIPRNPVFISSSDNPIWLTGGGYGSEGGAAATVVLIVACLFFVWKIERETR